MDFAEVNRRYEDLKQQYQAGTLTAEQFDDQLLDMMVRDDTGRWWAKARESGDWHYHDASSGDWVRADPPGTMPTVIPPVTSVAKASPKTASPQPAASQPATSRSTSAPQPTGTQAAGAQASTPARPTWAAVVPPSAATITAQPPVEATRAGSTGSQSQSTAPHAGIDFGPLPELSGAQKVIFYLLAFFIPLVGIILFFVYRHKPAAQDRSAARVFLILGIVSLLLSGLCGATLIFADMMVASLLQY